MKIKDLVDIFSEESSRLDEGLDKLFKTDDETFNVEDFLHERDRLDFHNDRVCYRSGGRKSKSET